MGDWRCVLELDAARTVKSGDPGQLAAAIGRGSDLRIQTEFRHNEHIDVDSKRDELVREVAEFGVTYLVDHRWVAGVMSLRQPISLPEAFGPRSSMSFFLYNQDGTQAIARPHLDGGPCQAARGRSPAEPPRNMRKYHVLDAWDGGTNAPSQNFVYDFDCFRYFVDDSWTEVLRHSGQGEVLSGSLEALVAAFSAGAAIKLGVTDPCRDLGSESPPDHPTRPELSTRVARPEHSTGVARPEYSKGEANPPQHELFVQGGSAYYYTEQHLFVMGTHPIVRVRPAVPMRYASGGWDFGWLMVRSDGQVVYRRCDPYTLLFTDHVSRHEIRWYVRGA